MIEVASGTEIMHAGQVGVLPKLSGFCKVASPKNQKNKYV